MKENNKKLSLKDAIKVAKNDCEEGICWAIEVLENMGFDCGFYWETMAGVEDVDVDDLNIKTRDKLYDILGITDVMTKAYSKV